MKPEAKSETNPSLPRIMAGRDFSGSLNFRADFTHNISTKVRSTSDVADFFAASAILSDTHYLEMRLSSRRKSSIPTY